MTPLKLTKRNLNDRTKPIVRGYGVEWPWIMSSDERRGVDNATRGEHLDIELYDRVLDARVSGRAVKTGKVRNG